MPLLSGSRQRSRQEDFMSPQQLQQTIKFGDLRPIPVAELERRDHIAISFGPPCRGVGESQLSAYLRRAFCKR